ncbi:MAG: DUF58 domain-containing protein [Roseiflexus sp.]|nr:DUF58 domain-containing protein [Roseiflexus sp.]
MPVVCANTYRAMRSTTFTGPLSRAPMMVKEFDQERAGTLWIALDLCAEAYWGPAITRGTVAASVAIQSSALPEALYFWEMPLELAVVIAASLVAKALGKEQPVSFLAEGGRPWLVQLERGPRQM